MPEAADARGPVGSQLALGIQVLGDLVRVRVRVRVSARVRVRVKVRGLGIKV